MRDQESKVSESPVRHLWDSLTIPTSSAIAALFLKTRVMAGGKDDQNWVRGTISSVLVLRSLQHSFLTGAVTKRGS